MLEEFAVYTMGIAVLFLFVALISLGAVLLTIIMECIEKGIPTIIFWIKSKFNKDKTDDTEGTK